MGAYAQGSSARNASLDGLRIGMAIMVIGLHTDFLVDVSPAGRYLLVNGLFRLAVPTFILINGYYFHDTLVRHGATAWLKRLLSLYLVWTSLYAYFWLFDRQGHLEGPSRLLTHVFFGYGHLWFLPGALGAALTMLMVKRWRTATLAATALALYATGVAVQYVGIYDTFDFGLVSRLAYMGPAHRNFLLMGFPFFCMGYLIRRERLDEQLNPAMVRWAAATGVLAVLLESAVNQHLSAHHRLGLMDNLISLMLACPALFLVAQQCRLPGQSKQWAQASAAMFFVHVLFIECLQRAGWQGGNKLTLAVLALTVLSVPALLFANRRWPHLL